MSHIYLQEGESSLNLGREVMRSIMLIVTNINDHNKYYIAVITSHTVHTGCVIRGQCILFSPSVQWSQSEAYDSWKKTTPRLHN